VGYQTGADPRLRFPYYLFYLIRDAPRGIAPPQWSHTDSMLRALAEHELDARDYTYTYTPFDTRVGLTQMGVRHQHEVKKERKGEQRMK